MQLPLPLRHFTTPARLLGALVCLGGPLSATESTQGAAEASEKRSVPTFLLDKLLGKNPRLEMTVFTEMTDYGKSLREVSPQQPMYFISECAGFKPMGEAIAREKPPSQAELDHYLFSALEARGFKPAVEGGESPELVLIYYWGSHNTFDRDRWMPEHLRRQNLRERAWLIGGPDYARDLMRIMNYGERVQDRRQDRQYLKAQASEDVYYVAVSAYSYADLARDKRQLAWRTTMTVSSGGVAMRTALKPLVVSAGDFFGRATSEPVAILRHAREGEVEIGPVEVVETDTPAPESPDN